MVERRVFFSEHLITPFKSLSLSTPRVLGFALNQCPWVHPSLPTSWLAQRPVDEVSGRLEVDTHVEGR